MNIACVLILALTAPSVEQTQTRVRVLTYNIHHGAGRDEKLDLDRIAALIHEQQPDIVCLQEVDRNQPRSGKLDFPALFAAKLNMQGVFESNYNFDGGHYGNMTLTRFPVVSHENIALPGPAGREPRGCLRVTVRVNDRELDVFNTHLGLEAEERKAQVSAILPHIGDRPTVLAGDFNATLQEPPLQILLQKFKTTNPVEPVPDDARAVKPRRQIDFILVSGPVDVLSSRIISGPVAAIASDHLPVMADILPRAELSDSAEKGIHDTNDERVDEAITEGH